VPQPEDHIKAKAKEMLSTLQEVNEQVIPLFRDTAFELI
jgi:hypothetical protein